jgi:hypothetical protein
MWVLSRETMKSQCREKAYDGIGSVRGHFGKSVILTDLCIRHCIKTTIQTM